MTGEVMIERYVVCVMIWDRRRSVIVEREAFRNGIPRLTGNFVRKRVFK